MTMITQTGYGQMRGSGSCAGDSWSILLCLLGLLLALVFPGSASAQLSTLSAGNTALEWQKSQREQLEMQLSDDSVQALCETNCKHSSNGSKLGNLGRLATNLCGQLPSPLRPRFQNPLSILRGSLAN